MAIVISSRATMLRFTARLVLRTPPHFAKAYSVNHLVLIDFFHSVVYCRCGAIQLRSPLCSLLNSQNCIGSHLLLYEARNTNSC